MRKIVILLLYIALFTACSTDTVPAAFLELSSNTLQYSWSGGAQDICVEANNEWYISSSLPSWLSVDFKSDTDLSFTTESNNTKDARFCDVVFFTEWQKDTLHIVQTAKERLAFVGDKLLFVNAEESSLSIEIDRNVNFEIAYLNGSDTWLSQTQIHQGNGNLSINNIGNSLFNNKLSLKIEENTSLNQRFGNVVIHNSDYNLADTLCICQAKGYERYKDGEVIQLQQALHGNVNLVIMGDGFTSKTLGYKSEYYQNLSAAADYFFSIEPYKYYRDYFNVYMVVAESKEEGVGDKSGWQKTDNKFGSAFGSGTEIVCNDKLVLEYARKVKEIPNGKPLTVIVVLNSSKYAGTTYLYSDGNSIALCPMSAEESPNDFEGLIHHEAGGHGFGFLCDEYVYYQKAIPESRKQEIKEWQKHSFQMNLDFTDDVSTVLWKDFIGVDKYKQVGVYEGGYEYQYGVWRSEENSCMNNNVPYFNVQSRWSIVSRIMKLSEKAFTVQEFIEADKPVLPDAATRAVADKPFRPLGEPIWIK